METLKNGRLIFLSPGLKVYGIGISVPTHRLRSHSSHCSLIPYAVNRSTVDAHWILAKDTETRASSEAHHFYLLSEGTELHVHIYCKGIEKSSHTIIIYPIFLWDR